MALKLITFLIFISISTSCSSESYNMTVDYVDPTQFMKKWYVIAGRFTFLEKGAHNAVETYKYDESQNKISIDFFFNKDSFQGPLKRYPQKGRIINLQSNAHWEISPFWPLSFDYLVIALDEKYTWTAIGVPNMKYLWIMSDKWNWTDEEINVVKQKIYEAGYPVHDIVRIPQKW